MSYSLYLPRIVHEEYNIGVSSEAKYAVKPKKQSQGGLSGAIIFTPDQLDFLETLKGSSKRQGEQLLRYSWIFLKRFLEWKLDARDVAEIRQHFHFL